MKPIGLTGDPVAQDAVGVLLNTHANRDGLELKLFVGLKTRTEACLLREVGGEIWHCGPFAPEPAMVGFVDRVVPGTSAAELAPQVATTLNELLLKSTNGETHHG